MVQGKFWTFMLLKGSFLSISCSSRIFFFFLVTVHKAERVHTQTDTHTHTHTQKSLSRVQLFMTPWIVAHQAPRSMGFSRHEYWSGLPFPSPRKGTSGINYWAPAACQAVSLWGWGALTCASSWNFYWGIWCFIIC